MKYDANSILTKAKSRPRLTLTTVQSDDMQTILTRLAAIENENMALK